MDKKEPLRQLLLDTQTTKEVEALLLYQQVNESSRKSIRDFDKLGYVILENFITDEVVEKINTIIADLIESGTVQFKYGNKIMFAIHHSEFLRQLWEDPKIVELLNHLIKGQAKLFQSINFLTGSQQKTHSDSIHMTTFPLGGLLGVWLALEDITPENGPLHYYPKSHKLPYYLNSDYDNEGSSLMLGPNGYDAYEKMLADKISEQNIKKQVFTARKGDLLIWHANLLHGGEPHTNKDKTRKSMVLHYFDLNRICYHEITQRPALIKNS